MRWAIRQAKRQGLTVAAWVREILEELRRGEQ